MTLGDSVPSLKESHLMKTLGVLDTETLRQLRQEVQVGDDGMISLYEICNRMYFIFCVIYKITIIITIIITTTITTTTKTDPHNQTTCPLIDDDGFLYDRFWWFGHCYRILQVCNVFVFGDYCVCCVCCIWMCISVCILHAKDTHSLPSFLLSFAFFPSHQPLLVMVI